MATININVERLKKEVLDIELEIVEGETAQSVIEKFKTDYENGLYHDQFEDYGSKDCDVCFQNLKVYDNDFNTIHIENLDNIPEKQSSNIKKIKP